MSSSSKPYLQVGERGVASHLKEQATLSGKEVASAAHVTQQALDSNEDMVNGPLSAARSALKELGWAMHAGGSALKVVSTGEIVHLSFTSPREVVRKAGEHWQNRLFVEEFDQA